MDRVAVKCHLPLGSGTSGWQNYGPFIWQWEKIHLIFANRPCISYGAFTKLITSKRYL